MVRTAANNTTETTYTFGHIEILLDSAGALKETRRYLPGGTLITDKPSAAPAISYLLKDHLGSLDVIVDDYGNIVQELSFDAWGLRRDTASWVNLDPIPMVFFNTTVTRKGFTGHEMLDDVGIIDMGGRIYDPRLGRFLQADPFIQAPMNSQSHNRYSYVLNNPLVNVDPSGFFLKKLFSKLGRFLKKVWKNPYVRMAVAIVASYFTFHAAIFAENMIVGAAAAGFVGGGIMTGSLKGAVMGALTAAVAGSIGSLNLGDFTHFAQGLGGGVMSDLQGGKFGHGFVSAGVGSYMGGVDIADDLGRYATAALVGGTVSKMTGGKFANGARAAVFIQTLSDASRYYEKAVGRKANPAPGKNRPRKTDYQFDSDGRQYPDSHDQNVIGFNEPISKNFWDDFAKQGGPLSKVLNVIPAMNATAALHDYWFNKPNPWDFKIWNVPTMLPAAGISIAASIGNYTRGNESVIMTVYHLDNQRRRRDD